MAKEKELELLKQAAMNEQEGYEFYMMAAEDTSKSESKQALQELANEEQKHKEWILDLYQKIESGSSEDFDLQQVESPSPELFRWKNVPLDNTSKALSVFSVGVKMEQAAIDFYKSAKEEVEDEQVITLLDVLIEWEKQHLSDFQNRYEDLQWEWWYEQGFSPS